MRHYYYVKQTASVVLAAVMTAGLLVPAPSVWAEPLDKSIAAEEFAESGTSDDPAADDPAENQEDVLLSEVSSNSDGETGSLSEGESLDGSLQENNDTENVQSENTSSEVSNIETENAGGDLNTAVGDVISGTFPKEAGKDLASVRFVYKDAKGKETYDFASVTETEDGYTYSFTAPTDGFSAVEGSNILAEYFTVDRWDGAVDVSWYDAFQSEFTLTTPAQLAGLAAIVNGSVDGSTPDFRIKGDRNLIQSRIDNGYEFPSNVVATAHVGLPENDFSDKTIILGADMDMGGGPVDHAKNVSTNSYDYPNWTPIGGEYLMDLNNFSSMSVSYFNGTLDGNGHRITNLYCYRRSYDQGATNAFAFSQGIGFIGMIGSLYNGESQPGQAPAVRSLSVSGYIYGRRMVGGIIGGAGIAGESATEGTKVAAPLRVENCANYAEVHGSDARGNGGIIGVAWGRGSIINCYNRGNISATYSAPTGGIVGCNRMSIYACYNAGTINTAGNVRGRGIGGHDDNGSNYAIDNCYYQAGCDDDSDSDGYYKGNMTESVSVNIEKLRTAAMTDGTLLKGLNANGTAYTAGADGYPVLTWENGGGNAAFSKSAPEGGTISASLSDGSYPDGTIVYLDQTPEVGWAFRYFTLNDRPLSGNYATLCGESRVSAYYEAVKAGVLNIADSPSVNITVTKNGTAMIGGSMQQVTDYPVSNGDALYENDFLVVEAALREGAVPDDPDLIYGAAVNMASPYSYHFTYTGQDTKTQAVKTFTVGSAISEEGVSLTLEVEPKTTQKLWSYLADTSWYDEAAEIYTINEASELAGLAKLVKEGTSFAGKTVLLGQDISLVNNDGTEGRRFWDGIGSKSIDPGTKEYNAAFAGTFDGQDHIISDMHASDFGLFAVLNGGTVKNVAVKGTAAGTGASGIVSLSKNGIIEKASSYVTIEADNIDGKGGILGQDLGGSLVRSCVNYGTITGRGSIGGIVGKLSADGKVEKCINKGALFMKSTAYGSYLGGAAGECEGSITESANYGALEGRGGRIGGIAASLGGKGNITDAYNAGDILYRNGVNGLACIGGIIGQSTKGYQLANVFNAGSVENASEVTPHMGSVFGNVSVVSTSKVEKVFFLDSSCEYVMDNGGIKQGITGIESRTAADFASEDDLKDLPTAVLAAINTNNVFVLTNGTYPELASAAGTHVHTGGAATCSQQAICEECGLPYGAMDYKHHGEVLIENEKSAVWTMDGYTGDHVCQDCGTIVEKGEVIPADTEAKALTVSIQRGGQEIENVVYTVAELDSLKKTSPALGYQFFSGGRRYIMAHTRYVTLEDLLKDLHYNMADMVTVTAKGIGVSSTLTRERVENQSYFWDEDGNGTKVPVSLGIEYAGGPYTLDKVAQSADISGSLRFSYGITEAENEDGTPTGGRLISNVTEMVFEMTEDAEKVRYVVRYSGPERYSTSFAAADAFQQDSRKAVLKAAVVASGQNFPDALAGDALAVMKEAPMLLIKPNSPAPTLEYIEAHVEKGSPVYLLGGEAAVPASVENDLKNKGYKPIRLSGDNRYATGMKILEAMDLPSGNETLLIASGQGFADALSGSAVSAPIMLTKNRLNDEQLSFIRAHGFKKIYLLGGAAAVSEEVAAQLENVGQAEVKRLGGNSRYETSYLIAKEFFGGQPEALTIASAGNFPDGLSGGPTAFVHNSPLILVTNSRYEYAKKMMTPETDLYIMGGVNAISEETVRRLIAKG